jgi:hypothetical protein
VAGHEPLAPSIDALRVLKRRSIEPEIVVSHSDELEQQLRLYLAGEQSIRALNDWLDDHAQQIADSDDAELRRLAGRVWNLISQHDLGSSEEYVRHEVIAALQISGGKTMVAEASPRFTA